MNLNEKKKIQKEVKDMDNVWELMTYIEKAEKNIMHLRGVLQGECNCCFIEDRNHREAMSSIRLVDYYAMQIEIANKKLRRVLYRLYHDASQKLIKSIMKTK